MRFTQKAGDVINIFLWAIPGIFLIYFCLFKLTIQFLQQIYVKNVMSIKYMALGFKLMTFGTQVSSHNH